MNVILAYFCNGATAIRLRINGNVTLETRCNCNALRFGVTTRVTHYILPKVTPAVTSYFLPETSNTYESRFLDSIIDSSFASTAETGCDWLKQNCYENVLFQFRCRFISVSSQLCGQLYEHFIAVNFSA